MVRTRRAPLSLALLQSSRGPHECLGPTVILTVVVWLSLPDCLMMKPLKMQFVLSPDLVTLGLLSVRVVVVLGLVCGVWVIALILRCMLIRAGLRRWVSLMTFGRKCRVICLMTKGPGVSSASMWLLSRVRSGSS